MIFKSGIVEMYGYQGKIMELSILNEFLTAISGKLKLILFSQQQSFPAVEVAKLFPEESGNILHNPGKIKVVEEIRDNYKRTLEIYSTLAKQYSLYISPGIVLEVEGEDFYYTSFLFNPEGDIILKQRQIHTGGGKQIYDNLFDNIYTGNQQEKELDNSVEIKAGSTINYADTEIGTMALMLGMDCRHPEIGRIMALEGVDIVLAVNDLQSEKSSENKKTPWQQLAGVWSQVQQNQFIALEACIGGWNLIHAPCEITTHRTGILAPVGEQKKARREDVVSYFDELSKKYDEISDFKIISTDINMDSLKEIRKYYPIMSYLNKSLYFKEMGRGSQCGKG